MISRYERLLQHLHILTPEAVAAMPMWWRLRLMDALSGLCGTIVGLEDKLTEVEGEVLRLSAQLERKEQQAKAHESFMWGVEMDLAAPMDGEEMMPVNEPAYK